MATSNVRVKLINHVTDFDNVKEFALDKAVTKLQGAPKTLLEVYNANQVTCFFGDFDYTLNMPWDDALPYVDAARLQCVKQINKVIDVMYAAGHMDMPDDPVLRTIALADGSREIPWTKLDGSHGVKTKISFHFVLPYVSVRVADIPFFWEGADTLFPDSIDNCFHGMTSQPGLVDPSRRFDMSIYPACTSNLGTWQHLMRGVNQIKDALKDGVDATVPLQPLDLPLDYHVIQNTSRVKYQVTAPDEWLMQHYVPLEPVERSMEVDVKLCEVAQLVPCIPPEYAMSYDGGWMKAVMAIANAVKAVSGAKKDFMELAHVFSKLAPDCYSQYHVNKCAEGIWKNCRGFSGAGSVIYMARESAAGREAWAKVLAARAASEPCLFVGENVTAKKCQHMFEQQWARAGAADGEVVDLYLAEIGNCPWVCDGEKVYRIDEVSGLYRVFDSENEWKAVAVHAIKSVVLPLWMDYVHGAGMMPAFGKPEEWGDRLARVTKQLHSEAGFLAACAKVLVRRRIDNKICTELDSRRHLIGFDNGVIDLDTQDPEGNFVLRKARADEYVSKSCGYDYEALSVDECQGVYDVLADLWVKRHVVADGGKGQYGPLMTRAEDAKGWDTFDKAMMMICSNLKGGNAIQSLVALLGLGSNGKSVLVNLIKGAMGEYCCNIPSSFWTAKSMGSEGPSPTMLSLRGCRYAFTTEIASDGSVVINVTIVKNVTGGDEMSGRYLFCNKIHSFYIDALPIWLVNVIPTSWSEKGHAATRRPKGIPFNHEFSDVHKDVSYAKLGNDDVGERTYKRRAANKMMNIMLGFYKAYIAQDPFVKVPMSEQMKDATTEVNDAIDMYASWLHQTIQFVEDDTKFIPTKFLFSVFKRDKGADVCKDELAFAKAIAAECKRMELKPARVRISFAGMRDRHSMWRRCAFKDAENQAELGGLLDENPPRPQGAECEFV